MRKPTFIDVSSVIVPVGANAYGMISGVAGVDMRSNTDAWTRDELVFTVPIDNAEHLLALRANQQIAVSVWPATFEHGFPTEGGNGYTAPGVVGFGVDRSAIQTVAGAGGEINAQVTATVVVEGGGTPAPCLIRVGFLVMVGPPGPR